MNYIELNVDAIPGPSYPVPIGIRGESGVTVVALDIQSWIDVYGVGALELHVRPKGADSFYPVALTVESGTASWTVSNSDTAVAGIGTAEFVYSVDEQVKKSAVFWFNVAPDVGGTVGEPPDPLQTWMDELLALGSVTARNAAAAAESAADAAEAAAGVEDLAVEAEETAPGSAPTVTKTIDPETGDVTLIFGIPRAPVDSVNGKTGAVTLSLDDIPDGSGYQKTTPQQVQQIADNASAIAGKYTKPAGGIPKTDLAAGVQTSLDKADTALQEVPNTYRTAAAQDAIDDAQDAAINAKYSKPSGGIPKSDMVESVQTSLNRADTALQQVPNTYRTAAAQDAIDGAQDAEINAKYTKPSGGIPKTDLAAGVQSSLDKADTALQTVPGTYRTAAAQDVIDDAQNEALSAMNEAISGKYTRPSSGIPKADLAAGVQTSLDKADTALQEIPNTYRTAAAQDVIDDAQDAAIEGKYTFPSDGIPKADLAAGVQTSLDKADTALQEIPNTYRTAAAQDVIDDAQNAAIASKYAKPSGGIPKTDLAAGVQTSLDKADTALQEVPNTYRTAAAQDVIDDAQDAAIEGKYTFPSGGIPAADLAAAVQASLEKADATKNVSTLEYEVVEG